MQYSHLLILLTSLIILSIHNVFAFRVRINAKLLGRWKVSPSSSQQSVHAFSASHCMARCNKKLGDSCDAVNYHSTSGKCTLIDRCARTSVHFTSHEYYFYSKRPQILSDGFQYEPYSKSCLMLVDTIADYATADAICAELNGRLVTLKTRALNNVATTLLKQFKSQHAWIGLRDIGIEGNPTHSDGSRALASSFFNPALHQWRNLTQHNCWAIRGDGQWVESSCKKRKLFSICEVPLF